MFDTKLTLYPGLLFGQGGEEGSVYEMVLNFICIEDVIVYLLEMYDNLQKNIIFFSLLRKQVENTTILNWKI